VAPSSRLTGFDLFDASGNDMSTLTTPDSFTAGTPVQVTLRPVDTYGNATVTQGVYFVALPYWLGDFRSTESGISYQAYAVGAGSNAVSLYFVPGATGQLPEADFASGLVVYVSATSANSITYSVVGGASASWVLTQGLGTATNGSASGASDTVGLTTSSGSATLTVSNASGWVIDIPISW
jgi:hypothetical protein